MKNKKIRTKTWEEYFKEGGKGVSNWRKPDNYVVEIVPLLKRKGFRKILELGCGSGRHTIFLAKKGFLVIGSDLSPTALKITQKRMVEEKLKNFLLICHNMTNFPFPNEHFDAIISVYTIHHNPLKKIQRTVREIKRTLRKGGITLIIVKSTKDWSYKKGKKIAPNTYIRPRGEHQEGLIHYFFNRRSIKKLFSEFKIINLREFVRIRHGKQSGNWYILAEKNQNAKN